MQTPVEGFLYTHVLMVWVVLIHQLRVSRLVARRRKQHRERGREGFSSAHNCCIGRVPCWSADWLHTCNFGMLLEVGLLDK